MRLDFKNADKKFPATNAFSLVEVLCAVVIAAITLAALFKGISTGFSMLNTTRANLRATQIMVSRLEGLRLCAWGTNQLFNSTIIPNTFTDYFYPLGLGSTTNTGVMYNGTMNITNIALSPASPGYSNNMRLVTVTVTWTDGTFASVTHTRSMCSYVAKYGIQNYVYLQ